MGIFDIGGGIAKSIESVSNVAGKAIDKIPDENLRRELEADLGKAMIDLNKADTISGKLFNSGWRPYLGWVCGIALTYAYLIYPIISQWVEVKQIDTSMLYQLILGMLGMAGLRTYEKAKGVARK